MRYITRLLSGLALAAAAIAPVVAQTYPNKPIKLILPFPPGGATDVMSRILAEKLTPRLGQTVIVENKPGAGTMLASEFVAKAPADGYTLLMAASSLVIAPSLYSKVNYDPIKDFTPVTQVAAVIHLVVVNPNLPVKSIQDLIAYLKANPGKVSYGSTGSGTSTHLEAELFKKMAGVDITHIPYKGSTPALADLVGGQTSMMFDPIASSKPYLESGRLRAIAVTTAQRSVSAPELPTVAESGLPGYEAMPWLGIVAPAGTPKPVVDLLYKEVGEVLKLQDVKDRFKSLGLDIIGNTPAQFATFIEKDQKKWAQVIKDSGAKVD
ncbi:tripartite tricarboxylate transporter substrate binding protein [Orrella sp. NBD-18]|uniref:Tripartite tricarboxylate transporter substrate binding protein n=1 Tax=Sheuella amnicola TaxID=2707330 RepID=A0A6B2QUN3_9BURK|nr:tripartite tricarboxylate transporter substrate binding protein [Sheuella amnicola]NDY82060.1 tripartite tricarboxylate transporter substrate binding protein [Sheuella amnicola]